MYDDLLCGVVVYVVGGVHETRNSDVTLTYD